MTTILKLFLTFKIKNRMCTYCSLGVFMREQLFDEEYLDSAKARSIQYAGEDAHKIFSLSAWNKSKSILAQFKSFKLLEVERVMHVFTRFRAKSI